MKLRTKFEDEDFKLGEVVEANVYFGGSRGIKVIAEPKEYWCIDCDGEIEHDKDREDVPEDTKGFWYIRCGGAVKQNEDSSLEKPHIDRHKEIGNYFETKEEAEKAVEKLKAYKRLKDKGFRFVGWYDSVSDNNPDMALFKLNEDAWETDTCDDLDLLFSGGEE